MGVAPFARVSAIIFRRYQPNEYTVSCLPVITLSISSDSLPIPGIVPRARRGRVEPGGSWFSAPESLCPNWMITKSPARTSASIRSQ